MKIFPNLKETLDLLDYKALTLLRVIAKQRNVLHFLYHLLNIYRLKTLEETLSPGGWKKDINDENDACKLLELNLYFFLKIDAFY